MVLCQLNRDAENYSFRQPELRTTRPKMRNLRESGAIEQDADVVAFIHRMREETRFDMTELIIAKHRNGRVGIIPLAWDTEDVCFRERPASVDQDDIDSATNLITEKEF
jgi:replicative DNA helicase